MVELDAFGRLTMRTATPEELAEFALDHAHHLDMLREFQSRPGPRLN